MDIRSDMEFFNSVKSCVLMCRYVDVSEEKPSRISKRGTCTEVLKHGTAGLLPDAEHEWVWKPSWVSASEGEDELTCAA